MYSGKDICNGKFEYTKFQLGKENVMKVVVAEIYNLCSFYIQMASNVNILNTFMDNLQLVFFTCVYYNFSKYICLFFYRELYNKYDELYEVKPEYITTGLVCASRFERTREWSRALILRLVDEKSVQVSTM